MLEKCKDAKERWGGVSQIIDNWLDERQSLISLYVHLPEHPIDDQLNSSIAGFCQVLMDYLSFGHFEVYEQLLLEGTEFNDGSVEKAQALLPKIQNTTDLALDFNDACAQQGQFTVQKIREFSEKLSRLGEALEERFALEDQMINILHTSHQDTVAS
ncbi:sigma D regulator [Pontibacter sp. JAM-7]|uniref:sigma D regulator n=1 Tax=Pontibacter sp. JAM-7 TaxID=3366581 RepID=UPI003AF92263